MKSRCLLLSLVFLAVSCSSEKEENAPNEQSADELQKVAPYSLAYRVVDNYRARLHKLSSSDKDDPFYNLAPDYPLESMKRLGFFLEEGDFVNYVAAEQILYLRADAKGHRDFIELHQRIGLPVTKLVEQGAASDR